MEGIIVGIDATNLRRGGGVTHLIELLNAVEPGRYNVVKIIIWSGEKTLEKIPERPWIKKINPPALNRSLFKRSWWQYFYLSKAARVEKCNVLFVPGGNFAGNFKPIVTMSRNLLPFEWPELRRYGASVLTVKLLLLRYFQSRSYRNANGLIFLTEYAKNAVLEVVGNIDAETTTIAHGLNRRFVVEPKHDYLTREYTPQKPCRILYVSIIDEYKHQWHVIEAIYILRTEGFQVTLDLVGPAYPPSLVKLHSAMGKFDPNKEWVHYHGVVEYVNLHNIYKMADIGVFASSCENMPNIQLETMAAGLPIACSNRGPMPEVLGDAGLYFDPENSLEIANAIRDYLMSSDLRIRKARASFKLIEQYTWSQTADKTFSFLTKIAYDFQNLKN